MRTKTGAVLARGNSRNWALLLSWREKQRHFEDKQHFWLGYAGSVYNRVIGFPPPRHLFILRTIRVRFEIARLSIPSSGNI